jgi:hypothetical protein
MSSSVLACTVGNFQPWFHGIISRKEAERLLAPMYVQFAIDLFESFILRPCHVAHSGYTLSSYSHCSTNCICSIAQLSAGVPEAFWCESLRIASATRCHTVLLTDAATILSSKTPAVTTLSLASPRCIHRERIIFQSIGVALICTCSLWLQIANSLNELITWFQRNRINEDGDVLRCVLAKF